MLDDSHQMVDFLYFSKLMGDCRLSTTVKRNQERLTAKL